jgi:hypothetical protein
VTGHGLVPVDRRLVLVALAGLLTLALNACGSGAVRGGVVCAAVAGAVRTVTWPGQPRG